MSFVNGLVLVEYVFESGLGFGSMDAEMCAAFVDGDTYFHAKKRQFVIAYHQEQNNIPNKNHNICHPISTRVYQPQKYKQNRQNSKIEMKGIAELTLKKELRINRIVNNRWASIVIRKGEISYINIIVLSLPLSQLTQMIKTSADQLDCASNKLFIVLNYSMVMGLLAKYSQHHKVDLLQQQPKTIQTTLQQSFIIFPAQWLINSSKLRFS